MAELNFGEHGEMLVEKYSAFESFVMKQVAVDASVMASVKKDMAIVVEEINQVGGLGSEKGQEVLNRISSIACTPQGRLDLKILIFNEFGTRG